MKSHEVTSSLLNVSKDAKSLRNSISLTATRRTDLSITGSVIGDEEFEFDDLVINSTAYRRVFMKQKEKAQVAKRPNDSPERHSPSPIPVQSDSHELPGK